MHNVRLILRTLCAQFSLDEDRATIRFCVTYRRTQTKKKETKNMTTLRSAESMNRSPVRRSLLLITLAVACFVLAPAPKVFAVSPAPDGGYPGNNTAEGTQALQSLTSGA